MIKPVLRGYKLLNQVTFTKTIDTIRQKFRGYETWRIAIGLQAVDGLRVSEYLLHTAKAKVPLCIRINRKSPTLFPKFHCKILGKKVGLIT